MATDSPETITQHSDLSALKERILLVGLTGGIGSGKTAVSDLLGKFGAGIIDTDLIAHQVTSPGGAAIPAILKRFGPEFIDSTGALNRSKMRTLVFANPESRQALEQITHPLIRQETIREANNLANAGAPYLVFVVPLLIESNSWKGIVDYLVVVDCPEETQIERVMHRSNLPREDVEKILQAQASREERLSQADVVIKNQGSLATLEVEVQDLHQKILQIQKNKLSSS